MKLIIKEFIEKYGFMMFVGLIGSGINRLRRRMSWKRFIGSIIISICVALSVGVIARDYFHVGESVTYVLCGLSGTFSETILSEIEEFIQNLSDILIKKLKK